ncbi:hypothetical protein [Chlorobaculum thiosulfatiphilum]|uniref:hypothetical protein n=1 Tax=Chlorobaculum thiosulfatiphilum TaxID=115852 RepID=UPI001476BE7C|nr:hypothetical protein [Chlorobaculum thiosulfatiphilum]
MIAPAVIPTIPAIITAVSAIIPAIPAIIPAIPTIVSAVIPTIHTVINAVVTTISEAIRMHPPVMDIPVPSYVIPLVPSDSVGKPMTVNDHPTPMTIMA